MQKYWPALSPTVISAVTTAAITVASLGWSAGRATAETPRPAVHPIYAAVSVDSLQDQDARRRFASSVARFGLGPVETMDIPAPAAPRAADLLRTGVAAIEALQFPEAQAALDAAAAEIADSGAAGLTPAQLADVFLFQATAIQKADWKDLPAPPSDISPPRAKEAYLRAAILTPDRVLPPRHFRPLVVASWALAVAEIAARPRGTILVRASTSAHISIDGGPLLLSPAVAQNLPYGDHVIRGEDLGRKPWVAVVALTNPTLEINVPETPAVRLSDAEAAAHALRMGAPFALVASLNRGLSLELQLTMIDAKTGAVRDAVVVPFAGDATILESTVMRLDEQARKEAIVRMRQADGQDPGGGTVMGIGQVPASDTEKLGAPLFMDDPVAWTRVHRPLVAAIGIAVGMALVLGLTVASDSKMAVK